MPGTTEWPALTTAIMVERTEPRWRYRSSCAAGFGMAWLRVWRAQVGYIAAVTDLGEGASITNSAEHIWAALVGEYGEPLVLLEHYLSPIPDDPDAETLALDGEHLDQVYVDGQRPAWRRIWPVPADHLDHTWFRTWTRTLMSTEPSREMMTRSLPSGRSAGHDVTAS